MTFHDGLPRVQAKNDQATTDPPKHAELKIVVDQSDHLTAAEAREFAQASLGAFDIPGGELDSSGGVKDMLGLPSPGGTEVCMTMWSPSGERKCTY